MAIGYELKTIAKELDQHLIRVFQEDDITPSQFRVLLFLLDNKNRTITQKDICEELESTHTTVIGLLKRMSEKGLVQTETNQENGRYKNVSLSDKGRELAHKVSDNRNLVEKNLVEDFSEQEVEQLKLFLQKLRGNIKKM